MKFAVVLGLLSASCAFGSLLQSATTTNRSSQVSKKVANTVAPLPSYSSVNSIFSRPTNTPHRTVKKPLGERLQVWFKEPRNVAITVLAGLLLAGAAVGLGFGVKALVDWLVVEIPKLPKEIEVPQPIKEAYTFFEMVSLAVTGVISVIFVAFPIYLTLKMGHSLSELVKPDSWSPEKRMKTMKFTIPMAGALAGLLCMVGFFYPMFSYGMHSVEFAHHREISGLIFSSLGGLSLLLSVAYMIKRRGEDVFPMVFAIAAHLTAAFLVPSVLCFAGIMPAAVVAFFSFFLVVITTMIVPCLTSKFSHDDEILA